MTTLIHERVSQAQEGKNKTVICRMKSGWAVLGDVQFLKGYSLLLPDPVVFELNSLPMDLRIQFLKDMTLLGDAIKTVTQAKRMNYEILGNGEPALHAHIFPRYESEPDELKRRPAWFYDWKEATPFDLNRDQDLISKIKDQLHQLNAVCL